MPRSKQPGSQHADLSRQRPRKCWCSDTRLHTIIGSLPEFPLSRVISGSPPARQVIGTAARAENRAGVLTGGRHARTTREPARSRRGLRGVPQDQQEDRADGRAAWANTASRISVMSYSAIFYSPLRCLTNPHRSPLRCLAPASRIMSSRKPPSAYTVVNNHTERTPCARCNCCAMLAPNAPSSRTPASRWRVATVGHQG